jgi:hypothetical protein
MIFSNYFGDKYGRFFPHVLGTNMEDFSPMFWGQIWKIFSPCFGDKYTIIFKLCLWCIFPGWGTESSGFLLFFCSYCRANYQSRRLAQDRLYSKPFSRTHSLERNFHLRGLPDRQVRSYTSYCSDQEKADFSEQVLNDVFLSLTSFARTHL